jgi:uncharacterized protein YciI
MPENQPEKKFFMLKTIPSRPTFQQDMTEDERNIMKQHVAYWTDKLDKKIAHVFGPVLDPKGGYGIGIIEVESVEQVQALFKDDPAVKSGLMKTEFHPMQAILRK